MWWLMFVVFVCAIEYTGGLRFIEVGNNNSFPIWIETKSNDNQPPLKNEIVQINPNDRTKFDIQDSGWAGRLWPKVGCDGSGANCEFGQSIDPCPAGGCQVPSETKVEFFFPAINSPDAAYYDISLVSTQIYYYIFV